MALRAHLAVLGLALAAASCSTGGQGTHNLVLTGSITMAPLVREVGKRFEASHPGVRVDVQADGTARGLIDTRQGLADVGMAARGLRPEEKSLHAFAVARDGIGLLVHKDNPVKGLTDDQVARIYNRAVTNWNEVGGPDATITVIHWAEGRVARVLFVEHFQLKPGPIRPDAVVGTDEQAVHAVAGNPNAIAYASVGPAAAEVGKGAAVRLLPLGGVAATLDNVRKGSYPFTRPLNLVTRDPPQGLAREFLDFARSDAVHDLIEKFHYVPAGR